MRRTLTAAAVAAAMAALLGAGTAVGAVGDCRAVMSQDDPPVPTGVTVCRQDAWYHQAQQRLSNAPNSGTPSWNTTKPTAAFQSGGAIYGALRPIDMVSSSQNVRPTFTGTFTGSLDNIAITYYSSSLYTATGGANALYTKLTIDNKAIFQNASTDPEIKVPVAHVDQKSDVSSFAFTNLAGALKAAKTANTPTTVHTISVSFVNKYYGDSNFVMYYDATEYPSGQIFNLEPDPDSGGLAGYTEVDTNAG